MHLSLPLLLAQAALASTTILYASLPLYDGNRGTYAGSTALCQQQQLGQIYTALQCRSALSMLLFDGMSYAAFSLNQSAPVKGPTDQLVATNWSQLIAGQLTSSLYEADVLSTPLATWWSGANALGRADVNCGNWGTNDTICILGFVGGAAVTTNEWASLQYGSCNVQKTLLCACLGGTPLTTGSPTNQPTDSPTRRPTQSPSGSPTTSDPTASPTSSSPTKSPTKSPVREPSASPTATPPAQFLVLYPAYPLGFGVVPANQIGASICTSKCGGFTRGAPLLCYSNLAIGAMPGFYRFNASVPIYNSFMTPIASNWSNFMNATLLASLNTMSGLSGAVWSGCTAGGGSVSANGNCGNWTSAAGTGEILLKTSTVAQTWMTNANPACTSTLNYVCVCINELVPTAAPTSVPTASPTSSKPTLSPTTSAPTKAPMPPTHSPTTASPTTVSPTTTSPTTSSPTTFQNILLYYQGSSIVGNGIAASTCTDNPTHVPPGCAATYQFLCYSTGSVANFPSLRGFDATRPVYGYNGGVSTEMAANWTNLMGATLLATASSTTGIGGAPWTGCTAGGGSVSSNGNCGGWTSSVGNGETGAAATTTASTWMAGAATACTQLRGYLCVCVY